MEEQTILIGTGAMAIAYAKVFSDLGVSLTVIGRGYESARKFEIETGIFAEVGGLDAYLSNNTLKNGTNIVICTGTEVLMPTLLTLMEVGIFRILIEKPGAISIEELLKNEGKLLSYLGEIYIGYNRRFYASVIEGKRMIEEDGGLRSIFFEFTEWAHKIEPLEKAAGVKENWFFANSTHVIDTAFYFSGKPIKWSAFSKGGQIGWHERTNFVGAGITENDVLFSYLSNWESAGRWSIELLTSKRRIYLKPLEKIYIQNKGSIDSVAHSFNEDFDLKYKPGLYRQVEAFLFNRSALLNIESHFVNSKEIYSKILSGAFENQE